MGKTGKAGKGRAKQKQKAQRGGHCTAQHPHVSRPVRGGDGEDHPAASFGVVAAAHSSPSTPRSASAHPPLRRQAIVFASAANTAPTVTHPNNTTRSGQEDEASASEDDDDDDDDDGEVGDAAMETNILLQVDVHTPQHGMANMHIDRSTIIDEDAATTATTATRIAVDSEPMPHPSPDALGFVVDTVGDPSLATQSKANGKRPMKRPPSPAPSDTSEEVVFRGRNQPAPTPTIISDPFSVPPPQTRNPRPHAPTDWSSHPTDDLLSALKGNSSATSQSPAASSFTQPPPQQSASQRPSSASSRPMGWASAPSKYDVTTRPQGEWAPASSVPYWRRRRSRLEVDRVPEAQRPFPYATTAQSGSKSRQTEAETSAALMADWKKTLSEKKAAKKKAANDDFMPINTPKCDRRGKRGRKKDSRESRNIQCQPSSEDDDDGSMGESAYDDYMQNLMAQIDDGEPPEGFYDLKSNAALAGPSLVVNGREIGEDEVLDKDVEDRAEENEGDWASYDSDDDEGSSDSDATGSSDLQAELEYHEQEQWEDEEDIRQRRRDRMTDEQLARLLAKQQELGIEGDDLVIDDGMYESISDGGFGDVAAARAGLSDMTNLISRQRSMRRRGGDKKFNFPDASALADSIEQHGESGFDIMDFGRPSLRPTRKGRRGKIPPALEYLSDEELRESLMESWHADRKSKRARKMVREELRRQGLLGSAGRKGRPDLDAQSPLGTAMKDVYDPARKFAKRTRGAGRGGGFGRAAVSLRNGEVVGAGAAEISHTGFGAKLMGKMGWSKGMGLGKDGEGMKVPVEQVMRIGTAGLG